ncbi:hypothetical protein AEP_00519 [Curvibacter sp. AEP1-3]|uniref:hypothetical protein n=1 Tax=Curvibacter sp. AEP1-3 TaxID=1844971 RepID=UPI000B3C7050|nr:hypothetical protein [Curvibacter sp. AEP1-3]ARV17479.1 hypothetical protein AEP_00519 [Curvibacter sp. AEP1-3]
MSTIVVKTVDAIEAALKAGTPVAPLIERGRRRPIPISSATAVAIRPVQIEVAQAQMVSGMPVSWNGSYAVECYARSGKSTSPDVAVDELVQDVYARLMQDPTLGGVVVVIRPQGIAYDFDADGELTACATLVFNVLHRANGATLS